MKSLLLFFSILFTGACLQGQTFQQYFDKGYDLIYQNKFQEALDTFEKALALKPNEPSTLYQSARALTQLGKTTQAFQNLNAAIKIGRNVIPLGFLKRDTFLMPLHQYADWNKLLENYERLDAGENYELYKELNKISELDQKYRRQSMEIARVEGWDSPKIKEIDKKMVEQDSLNLMRIEEIIAKYGYPGKTLVGGASSAAFMVIQHADLETQQKYLPLLQKAAEAGELSKSSLALLIDRVRVGEGKKQLYGTQYFRNEVTGEFEFKPIEDVENVNARRAEMGIMYSIEEYAKRFGIKWQ